ncbi:MAG: hypothetical protein NTW25_11055 [Candidatus Kapabacteria bacterium]|nr:hypothetical protein [Candidatus Kapabacteria bacterium]
MFKNKYFALVIVFLTITSILMSAEKPDFSVLAIQGDVTVKREKDADWKKINAGEKLYSKDQIKISKDAYIGLIHSTGSPMELKTSGNYTVQKLVSLATNKKGNDVTKRFTSYIVDEMSKSDDKGGSGYKDKMKTLGAVERAVGSSKAGIVARLPRGTYAIDNKLDFSWYKKDGVNSYNFTLKNSDGKEVFKKTVSSTNITVNLDEIKMKRGECYNWFVNSAEAKSDEFCVMRMTEEETKQVNNDISQINLEVGKNPGSIGHLVLAS